MTCARNHRGALRAGRLDAVETGQDKSLPYRLLCVAALAAAIGALAGILVRDGIADERRQKPVLPLVEARALQLVDGEQRPLARLEAAANGMTALMLNDTNGRIRAFCGTAPLDKGAMPLLALVDTRGHQRAQLGVGPGRRPLLQLTASDEAPRAWLFLDEKEAPRLALYGAEGRLQFGAP